MIYFNINGQAVLWNGEHINNIRYSRNIAQLWSDEELATIGLYRALPANPVPEGKIVVGQNVQVIEGKVKTVLELEDAPVPEEPPAPVIPSTDPKDYPLTARQIRLGLIRNGITLANVQNIINTMSGLEKDEAQIYWEFSNEIHWDHQMTKVLISMMGIDSANAANMWMAASSYER